MNKIKILLVALFTIALIIGCEDRSDLTAPALPETGNADFSRFVSLGNSLTAGYQSSALYESAQKYSFGNLIAQQVGVDYVQPTISDPGIGGRMAAASLSPFATSQAAADAGKPTNLDYAGIYNNLGIPGALLPDLLQATGTATALDPTNVFFDIILRGQGTALEQAIAAQPTLLTLWIGNNDILGYATSGGVLPHTPTPTFAFLYDQLCGGLAQAGIPVVAANIPDVTSIPFITTVGAQLLAMGTTHIVGEKSDGSVGLLDLTKVYLTLRASAELAQGKGTSPENPLPNSVILDEDEIVEVNNTIAAFNATIASVLQKYGFHLVDANSVLKKASTEGLTVEGIKYTTEYVFGGIFSLDGVHPSSQGYAIVANEFIKVINEKFSAKIPLVNVTSIPGSLELVSN